MCVHMHLYVFFRCRLDINTYTYFYIHIFNSAHLRSKIFYELINFPIYTFSRFTFVLGFPYLSDCAVVAVTFITVL